MIDRPIKCNLKMIGNIVILISFIIGLSSAAIAGDAAQKYIRIDDFKNRRLALLDSLENGTAIIYSSGRSGDAGYRSDSRFWYLTGLDDDGAKVEPVKL